MPRTGTRLEPPLALWVLAALAAACSGKPFQPGGASSSPSDGAPVPIDPGPWSDGNVAEGPADGTAPSTGLCGTPRNEDEICLPGGTFTMGSNSPNLGSGFADHTPAHQVTVGDFFVDAFEVTVKRYQACVDDGGCTEPKATAAEGCTFGGGDPSRPITCVSWTDAASYCRWDGNRRLPTEAEWEFAARNGDDRSYPWGGTFACSFAVLASGTACPEYVGSLPFRTGSRTLGSSDTGIFDLAGNVAEWVADWAGSYRSGSETDPKGPPAGASRILRGGSWNSSPQAGYTYARASAPPQTAGRWGFRCARDAER